MYHVKGSPADPNRLYASQTSGCLGRLSSAPAMAARPGKLPGRKGARAGEMPSGASNKFVYDTTRKPASPHTHQWYDGTQHPWEFKRVWHLEPSLTDPDTVYAGVEDAAIFRSTTALTPGMNWRVARPRHGSKWQPGAAGWLAHDSSRSKEPRPDLHCKSPPQAPSAPTMAARTWKPINQG